MNQQPQPSSENNPSEAGDGLPSADVSTKGKTSWWLTLFKPKVGIPLAILIVLAAIPLVVRGWRIASLPPTDEPFDVDAFCSVTIPDEENAFVEYRQAFDLFVEDTATREEWNTQNLLKGEDWEKTPLAFKKWISANERSLEVWVEGTRKPKACWVPRKEVSDRGVEYGSTVRSMARLAVMNAHQELHQNNSTQAWVLLHSAFRFSRHIGQEGVLNERILGTSILAIVTPGLLSWAHHPQTTATDLENAITTLSDTYSELTSPHSVTLKYEYIALTKLLSEIRYRNEVFDDNLLIDTVAMFVLDEPDFSKAALAHVFKNQLACVDQDLASRPRWIPGSTDLFDIPASSTQELSGNELAKALAIAPAIVHLGGPLHLKQQLVSGEIERCFHATMLAVLAIQHFVRLHGRFPQSLEECAAPDSAEPFSDPCMSRYQPLIYNTDGNYAVVYSVGVDGIDDGHSPKPTDEKLTGKWSQLRGSPREWFEGFRIPLWQPASDTKAGTSSPIEPDNVQD